MELGFLACGVAQATFLEDEAPRLEQWLRAGKNGGMEYMGNHFDMRLDAEDRTRREERYQLGLQLLYGTQTIGPSRSEAEHLRLRS